MEKQRIIKHYPPNPKRKLYLLTILCHRGRKTDPLRIAEDWLNMYCTHKAIKCGNQFMFVHDGDVAWIYNSLLGRGLGFTLVELPPETFRSSFKGQLNYAFNHHLAQGHDYGDRMIIIE